jgi:hypothetical protein
MALIKRTQIVTERIPIRLPIQAKGEIAALHKLADKQEVDFAASLANTVMDGLKTLRAELEGLDKKPSQHVNGVATHKVDA